VAGSTSATSYAYASSTGITALNILTSGGVKDNIDSLPSASGGASVDAYFVMTVTVSTAGATLTITPSTLVGGNAMDLFIVSLPSTVLTSKGGSSRGQLSDTDHANLLEQIAALSDKVSRLSCSTPVTPHTHVEAGLDSEVINNHLSDSVHIPRSMASQMMSLMGRSSL
jgi:hypothetical protein